MTTEEAMELFNKHNMPVAPINTFEMLKKEPQFTEREMLFEHSHPEGFSYHAIGNPIKLSESLFEIYRAPPTLGEHTSEILSSILGYSEEKIKDFRTKKVID